MKILASNQDLLTQEHLNLAIHLYNLFGVTNEVASIGVIVMKDCAQEDMPKALDALNFSTTSFGSVCPDTGDTGDIRKCTISEATIIKAQGKITQAAKEESKKRTQKVIAEVRNKLTPEQFAALTQELRQSVQAELSAK